jgi:ureidoacrylate peracid hydrolase
MLRSEIDGIPLEGDVGFRQRAVEPDKTALLVIDLQKGEYNADKTAAEPEDRYLWDRIAKTVIPNGQRLLAACRAAGIEVIFTTIESLTLDGRDRSLDYKISGIFAAKVFNSTNIEYVLRNLGIEYILAMGIVTDQCVETAVRDGCDRGFLMTLIDDACATHTQERHDFSLRALKGYCRVRSTDAVIDELQHV